MLLFLVRHAESTDNYRRLYSGSGRDVDLTVHGAQQAQALGARLKKDRTPASRIIVSTMKRTRATAAPIVDAWPDAEVVYSDLIVERHFGGAEGRSVFGLDRELLQDAETSSALTRRVEEFYQTMLLPLLVEDAGDVVVVSHGATTAQLLAVIFADLHARVAAPPMLANSSYHVLDIDGTNRKLRGAEFNVESHLSGVSTARAAGGVSNANQSRLDSFFKK
ncbi:histidine phosphatase superfamily [Myxozyma melibiosi]|uniref:Histidine phosphatase superfamily n=1 Tax=Myxozyma melibiosi TaxID=54550 RepID=A0ABR1EYS4_9ASCO